MKELKNQKGEVIITVIVTVIVTLATSLYLLSKAMGS